MATGLLVQVLEKNKFEFQILNVNRTRFAPSWIRPKMCVEIKEQAQAHYFGNILAIPVPL